jgi:NAD(P)-dependent dehydrogenase (short-subunit alcohol dehydrogenase family)
MKLEQRTAIVTGAGQGIGRAIALRLAQEGADLVLAGRHRETLEATASAVSSIGRRAVVAVTDVSSEDDVRALAQRAREALGRIDILVNNAGVIGPTVPVTELRRQDWDQVLAVNLTGALLCSQAVLPDMIARRAGKIINIASVAGKIGYALRSPYAVSKWGMIGLTMTLAKEAGPHNIQVNAVCPGAVAGDRLRRVIEQRARELNQSVTEVERFYVEPNALKRIVPPEEVAALVAYLASADADNITGQAIDVSAGYGV